MPEGRYVTRWSEFQLLPGVVEAIGLLNRAGLRVVVVSNQRGIALGLYTAEDVRPSTPIAKLLAARRRAHRRLLLLPSRQGAMQLPQAAAGLFEQARAEFPEIAAACSVMIGDSISDIEFGRRLGMTTVFIEGDPERRKSGAEQRGSLPTRYSFLEAVTDLLARPTTARTIRRSRAAWRRSPRCPLRAR